MKLDNFQKNLLKHTEDFRKVLATPSGDWSVKGFIDIAKNIYTISVDTKVVSKIIELMMFPVLQKFAKENKFKMILSSEQNHYPDVNESKVYSIDDLKEILSVVKDFDFLVQEKYKIAKDKPGSGNTKNIGSCVKISELKKGIGPFSKMGIKVFDDFWMNYMTTEMARTAKLRKPPYTKY